jgi:hypothetical protein
MTVADSTSFTTVKQQVFNRRKLTAGNTNDERFVAHSTWFPQIIWQADS